MKSLRFVITRFTMFSALSLVACGTSGVSSGVAKDKPADELSAEEIESICEATADYVEAAIDEDEVFCRLASAALPIALAQLVGADIESVRESCQDTYEACKEDPEGTRQGLEALGMGAFEIPEDLASIDCSAAPDDIDDCDVTVGEYEQCATDNVDALAAGLNEIPKCSALTEDDIDAGLDGLLPELETESPASCDVVEEAMCTGLSL